MLRGTIVKVNDKVKPPRLKGTVGIAVERMKGRGKKIGYIRVISRYQGWLTDLAYSEDELDIIEPPIEL